MAGQRQFFTLTEVQALNRIAVFKALIGEQRLEDIPCVGLARQLNALDVLVSQLQTDVQTMRNNVGPAGYGV